MLEDDLAMMEDNLEMQDLCYISSANPLARSVVEIKIFITIHNFLLSHWIFKYCTIFRDGRMSS
jgi:hypothetical protein